MSMSVTSDRRNDAMKSERSTLGVHPSLLLLLLFSSADDDDAASCGGESPGSLIITAFTL